MKKILLINLLAIPMLANAQMVKKEILPNDTVIEPTAWIPQKVQIGPSSYVTGYGLAPAPVQPAEVTPVQQEQVEQEQNYSQVSTNNNQDGSATIFINNVDSRNKTPQKTQQQLTPSQQYYNDVVGGSPYQMPTQTYTPQPKKVVRTSKQVALDNDMANITEIQREIFQNMQNGVDNTDAKARLKAAREKFNYDLKNIAN